MPTVGKLTSLAVLPVFMIGCAIDANKPQAFVGMYGEFADDWSAISRIVEKYGFDPRRMQVAPPSGASSALIIHGLSDSAESVATLIARDLELELEMPINDNLLNLSGTFFNQLGMEEPASVTGTYTRLQLLAGSSGNFDKLGVDRGRPTVLLWLLADGQKRDFRLSQ